MRRAALYARTGRLAEAHALYRTVIATRPSNREALKACALVANDVGTAEWIEFGRPYWDFRIRSEPETRLIEPVEGLMLLFPSYMFHRTLPFSGAGERISIAFDVLQVD